ncbi:MAG: GSCFA domain-containing protein [Porphyromonadaceae bacterium]|nr:GSCFA domain-containing protein [Porphyromonadaceae bacterium]
MEFRTAIQIHSSDTPITHTSQIMLLGSCFSSHIGNLLLRHKFRVEENPFGILYNPFSISQAINRLLSGVSFSEYELIYYQGLYHSLMHHGQFSDTEKKGCLEKIRCRFEPAAEKIHRTTHFLVTFGTAYAYRWKENGEIVGNCHQIPADRFIPVRLSVEEIVEDWKEVIGAAINENPDARFLFTVSPIRHWKDGAHENQLSKSILHLAIDRLKQNFPEVVHYFPAYELMMDELRDYRFYTEDMMHPTPLAIEYIWERFSDTFFSEKTRSINTEWAQIRKGLDHRPIYPDTPSFLSFKSALSQKLEMFVARYPEISCDEERNLLQSK